MILLKLTSRNLSCAIFILQSTFQVSLIGFGHNSWYRWDHRHRQASSSMFWKYLWLTLLILFFTWKVCYHVICFPHQLWLGQARSCGWVAFDMMLLFPFVNCVEDSLDCFWSHKMSGKGKFVQMASFKCSILKVFGTYLTYSLFWKLWYHVMGVGHKLWLEQAWSCKWLAFDMILLKQSCRNLSCYIFIFQSTFQVSLIGFGHDIWYRLGHRHRQALSSVFWKYLWLTLLILFFFWKVCYHVIYLAHQSWLEQARSCEWVAFDMMLLVPLC